MAKTAVPITRCTWFLLALWLLPAMGVDLVNEIPADEPEPYTGQIPRLLSDREFYLSLIAILFGLVLVIEYKLLMCASLGGRPLYLLFIYGLGNL